MVGSPSVRSILELDGRVMRTAATVLLAVVLGGSAWDGLGAPAATPSVSQSISGEAAWVELERRGEKASLVAALEAARYDARAVAASPGTVALQNPAQSLQATVAPDGVQLRAGASALRLRPIGVGYGKTLQTLRGSGVRSEGPRVEIDRASQVTEWWVNRPSGLEQGFTVHEAPARGVEGAWLRVAMAVEGDLMPRVADDGQSATFVAADGSTRLHYDHLLVRDATGRRLPTRMRADGAALSIETDDTQAVYPVVIDPTFTAPTYLKASISSSSAMFGRSVALSGDTAVVGTGNSETVYVFVRNGATWSPQASLTASNGTPTDNFGFSVAVSGDTIVVGAQFEDGSGVGVNPASNESAADAGAAYVFVRSGTTWSQQAYLKASNTGAADNFGRFVAVSGDTVVVGAPNEDGSGIGVDPASNEGAAGAGAAYVFVRSGTTWSQQAYLKASNSGGINDGFGYSVALSGDTAVVAAPYEDGSGTGVDPVSNEFASESGAAYVFVRGGTTWSQQAYLKASNTGTNDLFGISVAVSEDSVVVGAVGEAGSGTGVNPSSNDDAAYAGAAYVFERSGTTWSQQAYLKASNTGASDQFGIVVAVSEDTVVVGANNEDGSGTGVDPAPDDTAGNAGAAYVFLRIGTTWSQQAYLKASNTGAGDNFGGAVALSGGSVIVGAVGEDGSGTDVNPVSTDTASFAGAAYVFLASTPGAPTITGVTPGNGQLSVEFTAGGDGGSALTNYEYSTDDGASFTAVAPASTASPIVITGLTNGTEYMVRIRAVNANGEGAASSSAVGTPSTTPDAPTITGVTPGNGQLSVAFTAGADGGSALTNYEYSTDDGTSFTAVAPASTASPIVIPGLTNGTEYTVRIRAVNANGEGTASDSSTGTPSTTPGAPTITSITAGDGQLIVAFTAGTDGGSAITNYEYSTDLGTDFTAVAPASTASPIVITGLTNGTEYPVRIRAVNANGDGPASLSSNGTPSTTPGAPTITGITPGNGQLSVAFTAGADGGSALTNYEYSIDDGTSFTTVAPASTASPIVITGLSNGTEYTVRIRAVNANGEGPASGSSAGTPSTTPGAPTITGVTPGNGQLTVAFTAGGDGGSALTNYEYSTDDGTSFTTVAPASTASPIVITGLSNGTEYTVRIRAVNANGEGAASGSTTGTPSTTPSAPTITGITLGNGLLSVAFTAGADGGSALTNYEYSTDDGTSFTTVAPASTASPIVITGLSNGTEYTVRIRAVNANGEGPASGSSAGTPSTTPGAPTITGVTPGNGQLTVAFTAGGDGGSALTNYEYSTDDGTSFTTVAPASTASPIVITGLSNGTEYTVRIRAVNANGEGAASGSTTGTPSTTPSAPTITGITLGNGLLSVAFTAGADGGSALTNYEYSTDDGTSFTTVAPASTASPIVITGLTNGTAYTVRLRAVNANGAGTPSSSSTGTPSTTPGAPTIASVTPGNGQLTVAFTAGADGGSALTNYEYSTDDGTTFTAVAPASTASPIVITGLTNGTAYTVRLRAVNANGAGTPSSSSTGTPEATSGAPTITGVTTGDRKLIVAFSPGVTAGAVITNYQYSTDDGLTYTAVKPASTTSPIIIKRLTNGTTYMVRIRAVTTSGLTAPSGSSPGTPSTTPGAPKITQITAGNGQLSVAFQPGATGGLALTNYEYAVESGRRGPGDELVFTPVSPASTASPIVITGLTNGEKYTIRIRAVNPNGAGAASAPGTGKPKG